MVTDNFIDTFGDFIDNHILLIQLSRAVFKAIHQSLLETRSFLIRSVIDLLHIPSTLCDSVITQYLNPMLPEFSLNAFELTEEYYDNI